MSVWEGIEDAIDSGSGGAYYVEAPSPSDIDMFGTYLSSMLDDFQSEAWSQVTGLDDPEKLANWTIELEIIAEQFRNLAQASHKQFKEEFGMDLEW